MKNYQLLLRRIAGWLRPGGRLFVHIFVHRGLPYHYEVQVRGERWGEGFSGGGWSGWCVEGEEGGGLVALCKDGAAGGVDEDGVGWGWVKG